MKFYKLNSTRQVNVNIIRFLVNWQRKVSGPQLEVKRFLYPYWKTSVVCEEFVIPGSRLRIDLLNLTKRVAVEVSPSSSHSYSQFFHKSKVGFGNAMKRELGKTEWLERNGFTVVEVLDEDMPRLSRAWFAEHGVTL